MARIKRLHGSRRLLAALALLALTARAAQASAPRNDYLDLSPEQLLGAEVVSASKRAERVSETPAAIYIVTAEDIERSGAASIPEALRMVPGVNVARADAGSWAISIRGLNSVLANKLLVMIDGRAVYDPLFGGTYWELQDMPLSAIDRIEVVRGPGGTLWGANAVNGIINVITKSAAATQGARVSALYGTGQSGGTAMFGGMAGEMAYRLYARHSNYGDFERAGTDAGNHDAWHDSRAGFRGDWGENFTLQGDLYTNRSGQRFDRTQLAPPYNTVVDETIDAHGANLLARWRKNLDNGGRASVASYLDYTYRAQMLGKEVRLVSNIEGQYDFPRMGAHEVIAGVNYRNTSDHITNGPTIVLDPRHRSDDLFGLFIQDKIALAPDSWYLTLGAKIEHNDYSGFEYQPNARLQWLIDPQRTAWLAVSRAVRTPTRAEFDFNQTTAVTSSLLPAPVQTVLLANRDFEPEKLIAYEAGYRQQITPDLAADAALFFNRYNDLETVDFGALTLINNGIDPPYYYLPLMTSNASKADIRGGELTLSWNPARNWKLSGSYSLLDISIFVDAPPLPVDLKGAEGSAPRQQFNIRSYWNVTDTVSFDTSLYYVGALKAPDIDPYLRLDLNLGWRFAPGARFNLVGQNLLQGEHREFSGGDSLNAAEIGRSVYGKITWGF